MKKTVKIFALVMVVAMLALTLFACSKMINGKYKGDFFGVETTYEFKGKNVTRTTGVFGFEKDEEGTYKIVKNPEKDGELLIELTFGDKTETYSFSEGKEDGQKYIKINGFKLDLVK